MRSGSTLTPDTADTFQSGGIEWSYDVRADGSYNLTSSNGTYAFRASDGVSVEIESARGTAKIFAPDSPPEPNLSAPDETSVQDVPATGDDGTTRLPVERLTNNDTLNFMLAPSYMFRITVEPNATSIRDLGTADKFGEELSGYQILFDESIEKYREDGWKVWLDQSGRVRQYEMSTRDGTSGDSGLLVSVGVPEGLFQLPSLPAGTAAEVQSEGGGPGSAKPQTVSQRCRSTIFSEPWINYEKRWNVVPPVVLKGRASLLLYPGQQVDAWPRVAGTTEVVAR